MFDSKYPLAISLAAAAFAHHARAADTPECAQYEPLLTRAELSFKNVPVCARINPGLWGLRKELAAHGIGFTATSYNGYTYDVLGNNAKKQVYNGQNPSYNTSLNLYLTYDLTRIGFANDAQLTLAGTSVT